MFLLFIMVDEPRTEKRDWNWFLEQITPKMRQALANEAYRILHTKDDVEDVLQEAIIIAITKCEQLRDETKLFQWMFKIVRREAYSYHSKTSIHKLIERIKDIFEPRPMRPEAYLINKEESAILREFVDALDKQTRQIVLLKTSTDMSLKEIAHLLDLNYNTVRSKYQRSLEAIKHRLEEAFDEENK